MRTLITIIALLLLSCGYAQAANFVQVLEIKEQHGSMTATFSLGGTTIVLDDQGQPQISSVDTLQATLTLLHPETVTVTLPTFTGATFGDFTLSDIGKTSRILSDHMTTSASWIIEPYNQGEYSLPTLIMTGVDAGHNTEQLTLQLPSVQVIDPETTATNFDILPARKLPKPLPWQTIYLSLGIISLITFLFIFIKKNRRPKPLSPKQCALLKLNELSGDSKEKVAALSQITRHFIDDNFTLNTTEKTCHEYTSLIKKHHHILKPEAILTILKTCDESNYSGITLTDDAISDLISQTITYIEDSPEPLRPDEDPRTCGKW